MGLLRRRAAAWCSLAATRKPRFTASGVVCMSVCGLACVCSLCLPRRSQHLPLQVLCACWCVLVCVFVCLLAASTTPKFSASDLLKLSNCYLVEVWFKKIPHVPKKTFHPNPSSLWESGKNFYRRAGAKFLSTLKGDWHFFEGDEKNLKFFKIRKKRGRRPGAKKVYTSI